MRITPLSTLELLRSEGKRIGFTASAFDLMHAGHMTMLAEASAKCDFLIVGLLIDPTKDRPETKNQPVQSVFERWLLCQSNSYVDMVIPFETERDLVDMIKVLNPDVRFVGEEYRGTEHTGWDIPGVEIIYNRRAHSFSSSELRQRVLESERDKVR